MVGFDGSLNTGLTLRTVRIKNGIAEIRAGATLLYDSNPPAEELETELKASAMMDAVTRKGSEDNGGISVEMVKIPEKVGTGKSIVLIDHEDSFVHTLGNYLRQTGADVKTLRSGPSALAAIEKMVQTGNKPDMVVLSPGSGNPTDFELSRSIALLEKQTWSLGLSDARKTIGDRVDKRCIGRRIASLIVTLTSVNDLTGTTLLISTASIFTGLPETFEVARYHSLHGIKEYMPGELKITALSEDGIVMGIQHTTLPFAAVQFHPESILTSPAHGMTILENALKYLSYSDDNLAPKSGAEIVGKLEQLTVEELQNRLADVGLAASGSKSELVVRLALWTHKSTEARAGRLELRSMTNSELQELARSLMLHKSDSSSPDELIAALEASLLEDVVQP
mgnify:CR=1 FL=1